MSKPDGVKVQLPLKEWIAAFVALAGFIAWLTTMHGNVQQLQQDVTEIKADVKALREVQHPTRLAEKN